MKRSKKALPRRAQHLRDQIEEWRASRRGHGPMPAPLWDAAVALAENHGVYSIARSLRIDFGALKRRVDGIQRGAHTEPPARFVEIEPARLSSLLEPSGPVVEVCASDGTKLVIRFAHGEGVDVASLVAAFRAQQP